MMKSPRFEGDQDVTIPELNLNDAAKGNGNLFPFFVYRAPVTH